MSDKRFSALSSDPRYRLPSRKEARTAVDPRFKTLFTDREFQKKAKVDRYGRKLDPRSGKKELQKRYTLEKDERPKGKEKARGVEREVVGSSDASESEDRMETKGPAKYDTVAENGINRLVSTLDTYLVVQNEQCFQRT